MRPRVILLHKDHPTLLRARRTCARGGPRKRGRYSRHRCRIERVHGEAKTWHGLARAIRRGLHNRQIQAFLTAAVSTLKRLADAVLLALFAAIAACAAQRESYPAHEGFTFVRRV
jgi:IS5 family transposase